MRQKSSLRGLEELSACVGKDVRDAKRRQSARGFRTHLVGRAPRATRVASMITRADDYDNSTLAERLFVF